MGVGRAGNYLNARGVAFKSLKDKRRSDMPSNLGPIDTCNLRRCSETEGHTGPSEGQRKTLKALLTPSLSERKKPKTEGP